MTLRKTKENFKTQPILRWQYLVVICKFNLPSSISLNTQIQQPLKTTASGLLSLKILQILLLTMTESKEGHKSRCKCNISNYLHLNSLWSVWYGILATLLQGYLAIQGVYRFLECSIIVRNSKSLNIELDIQIVLCGFVLVLLPVFLFSALFKIGNLANDGIKLASGFKKCSTEPNYDIEDGAKSGSTWKILWIHCGPISTLLHVIIALCLLLPRLFLEGALISNNILPKEQIWQTDLDFILHHPERVFILSFTTSTYQNTTRPSYNYTYNNNHNTYHTYDKTYMIEKYRKSMDDLENYETSFEEFEPFINVTERSKFHDEFQDLLRITAAPTIKPKTKFGQNHMKSGEHPRPTKKHHVKENNNENHRGGNKNDRKNVKEEKHHINVTERGKSDKNHNRNQESKRNQNTNKSNKKIDNEYIQILENNSELFVPPTPITKPNKKQNKNNSRGNTNNKNQNPSKSAKDSEIHIVKAEKIPDSISTSAMTILNSKIIEIKPATNLSASKKNRRSITDDDSYISFEAESIFDSRETKNDTTQNHESQLPLISVRAEKNLSTHIEVRQLTGIGGLLQTFFDVKTVNLSRWSTQPSLEYLNLAFAILMLSVRYPAVFWGTSKCFASVFSFQMIINGLDVLLNYAGVSLLYKLETVGMLFPSQSSSLLLNSIVSIVLYLFATILIVLSSMVIYLYGHSRLVAKIKERNLISLKITDNWMYFAHCASLCVLLGLTVIKAPLIHDLSTIYRDSQDSVILLSIMWSIIHLLSWVVLWLGLSAKRRWSFKFPSNINVNTLNQPLLLSPQCNAREDSANIAGVQSQNEDIYWPKLSQSSPKLKVTFDDIQITPKLEMLSDGDCKRIKPRGARICLSSTIGEIDDGDYATLREPIIGDYSNSSEILISKSISIRNRQSDPIEDNISEEGKLLESVRDDSVTYASTRELEPPITSFSVIAQTIASDNDHLLAQTMCVTGHTSELQVPNITSPKYIRLIESSVLGEELTPRSDTLSNESSISPPDRALSDSSGVHSSEEKDEVIITPRPAVVYKAIVKPPPVIHEEPFGRSTNMKMSSFNKDSGSSSATLPLIRGTPDNIHENNQFCNTMPLPISNNQQYLMGQQPPILPSKIQHHTTLPNGVRCLHSNQFLRRLSHIKNVDTVYEQPKLEAGHHTFSKHLHNPIQNIIVNEMPPPPLDQHRIDYAEQTASPYG